MSAPPADGPPGPKLGLWAQLRSLSATFWLANLVEAVERLAYFGLRVVLPIYLVLPVADGGPEFSHGQKGMIFAVWAAIQAGLPRSSSQSRDRSSQRVTVFIGRSFQCKC